MKIRPGKLRTRFRATTRDMSTYMSLDTLLVSVLSSSLRVLKRVFASMARFLHVAGLRYSLEDVRWHEAADGVLHGHDG
jgi:hypothetical protein